MIRRPPRSTLDRSSAASDVYKRQGQWRAQFVRQVADKVAAHRLQAAHLGQVLEDDNAVSYTHLRAHETVLELVCRLLLEKKKIPISTTLTYALQLHNTPKTMTQTT